MAADSQHGPIVADHEYALRAVLCAAHWFPDEDRPSSALFNNDYFSVDLRSKTTIEESVSRMTANGKKVLGMVDFNCGGAREIGFVTRDELDPQQPDNLAHAHTYNTKFEELGDKARKKHAKKLVEICTRVIV
jgi:hypothetical protein